MSSSVSPAASRWRNSAVCAAQLGVGHRLVLRLQGVDRLDLGLQPLEEPGVGRAEQAVIARSNRPRMALPIPDEDFPNAFENFHE